MSDLPEYDVTVVGGGPAGLTAALYTTRLGHDTKVINRGGGRAAMMVDTHNVIGVTEDVSGNEFLSTAIEQIQSYGADYERGKVEAVERVEGENGEEGLFHLTAGDTEVLAKQVIFATGFSDVRPDPPLPRTGRGLHWCLHCDAYMFVDEPVFVMGTGEASAHVAMIMLNFTPEVDILTRGQEIEWSEETDQQVRAHPIDIVTEEVSGIERGDDGWLEAMTFEDDTRREYRGGFPMYGSDYNNELAASLGCDTNDDGTVAVDDHGRTSVDGVYAVGDLIDGHNQIPVAMGEGAKAGIAIHYDIRTFPMSREEIEAAGGEISTEDVPAMAEELRTQAREHAGKAGEAGTSEAAGDD
ncbi:thioredoxin-disulfide reductase [Halobacteriales archaeon QS_3_64_16]|nr:MAG: thioredoxin-disulfide reductase [Halobacteriales archaeon QS_3_64_16]